MSFSGFPRETLAFLAGINANNSRRRRGSIMRLSLSFSRFSPGLPACSMPSRRAPQATPKISASVAMSANSARAQSSNSTVHPLRSGGVHGSTGLVNET